MKNTKPLLTKKVVTLEPKAKRIRKTCPQRSCRADGSKRCDVCLALKEIITKGKDHCFNVTLKKFISSAPATFWQHFPPGQEPQYSSSIDGENAADKAQLAIAFNCIFCSFFTQDDDSKAHFIPMNDVLPTSDISVCEQDVLPLLLNFDTNKTTGVDGITSIFLVRYTGWCIKQLFLILKKLLPHAE